MCGFLCCTASLGTCGFHLARGPPEPALSSFAKWQQLRFLDSLAGLPGRGPRIFWERKTDTQSKGSRILSSFHLKDNCIFIVPLSPNTSQLFISQYSVGTNFPTTSPLNCSLLLNHYFLSLFGPEELCSRTWNDEQLAWPASCNAKPLRRHINYMFKYIKSCSSCPTTSHTTLPRNGLEAHCYESLHFIRLQRDTALKPRLADPRFWLFCGDLFVHVAHKLSCWWNVRLAQLNFLLRRMAQICQYRRVPFQAGAKQTCLLWVLHQYTADPFLPTEPW